MLVMLQLQKTNKIQKWAEEKLLVETHEELFQHKSRREHILFTDIYYLSLNIWSNQFYVLDDDSGTQWNSVEPQMTVSIPHQLRVQTSITSYTVKKTWSSYWSCKPQRYYRLHDCSLDFSITSCKAALSQGSLGERESQSFCFCELAPSNNLY